MDTNDKDVNMNPPHQTDKKFLIRLALFDAKRIESYIYLIHGVAAEHKRKKKKKKKKKVTIIKFTNNNGMFNI